MPIYDERRHLLGHVHSADLSSPEAQPADQGLAANNSQLLPLQALLGQVQFNLVEQGARGDCWFIAVLADLAYHHIKQRRSFGRPLPGRDFLPRVFPALQQRLAGQAAAELWWRVAFEEHVIAVDNAFPNPLKGVPNTAGNDWVMLLEKAYAKRQGKWGNINGSEPQHAFNILLGLHCHHYGVHTAEHKEDEIWQAIGAAIPDHYIAAYTRQRFKHTKAEIVDELVTAHVYSVFDRHEPLPAAHLKGVPRMLLVRNPWGANSVPSHAVYDQQWSAGSTEWAAVSDADKEFLKAADTSDGEFWLPWNVFCTDFTGLVITKG